MKVSLFHSSEGHKAAIYSICVSPNGTFYTGDGNGWLVQWSLNDPEQGKLLVQTGDRIFALMEQGETLWAGTMVGHLILVNKETKTFRKIEAHQKGIFGIYEWQDYTLTIGGDGALKYWTKKAELVYTVGFSENSLRGLAFHPVEPTVIIGASDATIYHFDLVNRRLIKTFPDANAPSVFCLAWVHPLTFVSGGRDAKLIVWPTKSLPKDGPYRMDAHWYTINDIAVHPEEDLFATASRDRTIKIWEKSTFTLLKVIDAVKYGTPNASVNRLRWIDQYLISVGDDRKVNWWHFEFEKGEAVSDHPHPNNSKDS